MIAYLQNHPWVHYILILALSISLSFLIIPSIIFVAQKHQLYDDLKELNKRHHPETPRLGGMAIFFSFTITVLLLSMDKGPFPIHYLLAACIILFIIGIKDDLAKVHYRIKLAIEFLAASFLVILGNIRLRQLNGLFGMDTLSYFPSVALSILAIMFIINAFNLIDGVDGLAATTGIVVNGTFSILFITTHQHQIAAISLSLTGSILGFIKFNLTPAKIFMGDTGALLIGLVSAIMAIEFVNIYPGNAGVIPKVCSPLVIVIAILIGPISDTLRVFIIRLAKGKSPFRGDRNHIHHRILKLGFTHLQTTLILAFLNVFIILIAFLFASFGNMMILFISLFLIGLNWILIYLIHYHKTEATDRFPTTTQKVPKRY